MVSGLKGSPSPVQQTLKRSKAVLDVHQPKVESKGSHTPSVKMLQKVQSGRSLRESMSGPSSPRMSQRLSQGVSQTPSSQLEENHESLSGVLSQTKIGQTIKQISESEALHMGIDISSKVSDIMDTDVTIRGEEFSLGELMDSLGEDEWNVETAVLAEQLGLSEDTITGGAQALDLFLKVSKASQSARDWFNTESDNPEINQKRLALAKDTFSALGGDKTLKLGEKLQDFYANPTQDTFKNVLKAAGDLQKDDGAISTLERSALRYGSQLVLGTTTTGLLARVTPGLSYASAAIDTGAAMNSFYNWYYDQGDVSGMSVIQNSITAIGSGTGATIAPVVGPLIATGLNLAIDGVSSLYSWWNG